MYLVSYSNLEKKFVRLMIFHIASGCKGIELKNVEGNLLSPILELFDCGVSSEI